MQAGCLPHKILLAGSQLGNQPVEFCYRLPVLDQPSIMSNERFCAFFPHPAMHRFQLPCDSYRITEFSDEIVLFAKSLFQPGKPRFDSHVPII